MQSLPQGYRALVIGGSGAIGAAMVSQLQSDPRCGQVLALSRRSNPSIDFTKESSIALAAEHLRDRGPLHLLIVATGMLHGPSGRPEKRLSQLNYDHMMTSFSINTFGPAAVMAHFTPLQARHERGLFAVLSAKVGSIADNRLGGWYSYRTAKAALNMLVKTASIELARTHPQAVVASLHPGTVDSPLSAPFHTEYSKRSATQAATYLLKVLDQLPTEESGRFWSYDGQRLPW
ncbi:Rossmann-fold NAD(P)-binding domain-containing protein [Chitinimonas naiadis]